MITFLKNKKATIIMALAFIFFGLTGITKANIAAPTGFVSMIRAFGGSIALFLFTLMMKKRVSLKAILKNIWILVLSGVCLAANWLTLFTAFRLAGVGISTILDYLAPVLVFFLSPLLFHEKITWKKSLIAVLSLFGVVLVSGAFSGAISAKGDGFFVGILLGLAAAATYAVFIVCNKKVKDIDPFDKGIAQMAFCGISMIPYVLITEAPQIGAYVWTPNEILLILFFIFIQTGLAYGCYFYAIGSVSAQKSAVMSFIDPVITLLIAVLFLHERMDWIQAIGSVVILAGAVLIDLDPHALRSRSA